VNRQYWGSALPGCYSLVQRAQHDFSIALHSGVLHLVAQVYRSGACQEAWRRGPEDSPGGNDTGTSRLEDQPKLERLPMKDNVVLSLAVFVGMLVILAVVLKA